jgi:hypothetical protein
VTSTWTGGPSGSRWEPQPAPAVAIPDHPVTATGERAPRGQRRRGVVALLATALTLGAASAGAAYASSQERPAVNPTSATSHAPHPSNQRGTGADRGADGDQIRGS